MIKQRSVSSTVRKLSAGVDKLPKTVPLRTAQNPL